MAGFLLECVAGFVGIRTRTCIKLKIPFFDYLGDRLADSRTPRPTPRNPPHSPSNLTNARQSAPVTPFAPLP